MNKQFFLLTIFSFGAICISPISISSAKACDKNTLVYKIKTNDPVNNNNDAVDEDYYSSSTMIYPLNHF